MVRYHFGSHDSDSCPVRDGWCPGFVRLSYRMQKQRCLGHEEKLQLGICASIGHLAAQILETHVGVSKKQGP